MPDLAARLARAIRLGPQARRRRAGAWLGLMLALGALVGAPVETWARSSGGYSRPSGSLRTPSFSRGGGGYRTPSFGGGGYSRPSYRPRAYQAPASPGDSSFSRSGSAAALGAFRAQQDAARRTPPPAPPAARGPATGYGSAGGIGGGLGGGREGWLANRGWSAPPPAYYGGGYGGGGRSFGAWDGLFLGAMLSNLGRAGTGEFFHNNQNDPGYRQWRAQADQQAQDNAELRRKLDELDRQLAERQGQPRTPGALPPDVPAAVAKADPTRTPGLPDQGGGTPVVWVVVLVGAGGLAFLAWRRHGAAKGRSGMSAPPSSAIGTAGAMLRHKLSGEGYTPDKFRVGMTLELDPTPFILAGNAIKVPQPEGTGSGQVSVAAVGQVQSGGTALTRLYLPDGRSLVQLHLNVAGDPDECRLFGTIDEVTPADPGEWGAWLDPNEGMIGWTQFQTKDGKVYDRAWAPGQGRAPPRALTETIEGPAGTRTVQSQAMLYAAATGVAAPGPQTEYIMVSAVQDGGRAWVEVRAGIDLNPATLQLA